jgi:phage baseplate assembly protein W
MALIKGIRRISPLDLNKNVTIGVAFPLDETNLFKGTETLQEQAKSNLINLLLTQRGERVNVPNYGIGLKSLLFENNIDQTALTEIIQDQTSRYISNIKITNVNTNLTEENTILGVSISYIFTLNSSTDNIQINFNI